MWILFSSIHMEEEMENFQNYEILVNFFFNYRYLEIHL